MGELATNPVPVTCTVCPSMRSVAGVAAIDAGGIAGAVGSNDTGTETASNEGWKVPTMITQEVGVVRQSTVSPPSVAMMPCTRIEPCHVPSGCTGLKSG